MKLWLNAEWVSWVFPSLDEYDSLNYNPHTTSNPLRQPLFLIHVSNSIIAIFHQGTEFSAEFRWERQRQESKQSILNKVFVLYARRKSINIQHIAPKWFLSRTVHSTLLWHCCCNSRRPQWISSQVHTATSHGWIKHNVKGGLSPNSSLYIIRQ